MAAEQDRSAESAAPDPDKVDAEVSASDDQQLTDEEARKRLGVSSGGIDRKKMIIGGIVTIIFLIIIFVSVIPWFADYSEVPQYLQSMTTGEAFAGRQGTLLQNALSVSFSEPESP